MLPISTLPAIITRKEWGASEPRSVLVKDEPHRIVIHHSATSAHGFQGAKTIRAFQRYHMNDCGWADIAYHFIISPDGKQIFEGRPMWALGAHCGGKTAGTRHFSNTGSLGICAVGNYDTNKPDPEMIRVLNDFILRICHDRHITQTEIFGHCENISPAPKTCPGKLLFIELFGQQRYDKVFKKS